MTFKIHKPALAPARGTSFKDPVEKLNMATQLLLRTAGDPMQSAVRLGELFDAGLLRYDASGLLVPGPALSGAASPVASFKNKIINGAFDYWQRNTAFGAVAGSAYLADRFVTTSIGSSRAVSRQAFALGQTEVPGDPTFYHRTVVSSVAGAGNASNCNHWVEGLRTLSGVCTLSFYARADAARPMSIEFVQVFGTGGAPSPLVLGIGVKKLQLSTQWAKYVVTASLPSLAGKTFGTSGDCLGVAFWFEAGSSFDARTDNLGQQSGTFDIAQVQLEAGDEATDFERRFRGTELMMCQRYYEKSYNLDVVPGSTSQFAGRNSLFIASSATGLVGQRDIRFKVSKRIVPAVAVFNDFTGTAGMVGQDDGSNVAATINGLGTEGFYVNWANTVGRYGASFHYISEAEF